MQKILDRIGKFENFILVWTILGLAIIGFVQVFTRYVFNYSFTWFEELGRYLSVLITFLGASIGVKKNSHFTMDLIVSHLKPPVKEIVISFTYFLCTSFFFLVSWHSWKIIGRMYGYGATSPTLQVPMYIVYLPILVFSISMGFRYLIKAFLKFVKILGIIAGRKEVSS